MSLGSTSMTILWVSKENHQQPLPFHLLYGCRPFKNPPSFKLARPQSVPSLIHLFKRHDFDDRLDFARRRETVGFGKLGAGTDGGADDAGCFEDDEFGGEFDFSVMNEGTWNG